MSPYRKNQPHHDSRRAVLRRLAWMNQLNQRMGHVANMALGDLRRCGSIAKGVLELSVSSWPCRLFPVLTWFRAFKAMAEMADIAGRYPDPTLTERVIAAIQSTGQATVSSEDLMLHYGGQALKEAEIQFRQWCVERGFAVQATDIGAGGVVLYSVTIQAK